MKVLLISENPPSIYGGIERCCYNIQLLFKNDSRIIIESLSKENIKYKEIRGIHKVYFDFDQLKQAIQNSCCDIVHIHGFASFVVVQAIIAASQLNKKIVYTAHFHPFKRLDNPNLGRLFFKFMLKPILLRIKTIITINKEDTAFFNRYHPHVVMVPNWLSHIEPPRLDKQKNMILFVGRNDKNKSLDYLLGIPSQYEVHCVTNDVKGLRDDFIFHYKISDVELNELYERASLLVVPSRYEAFSYVVLEALMKKTPVLISDNVRIADYLDGVKGLTIFKYGDYSDFQNKIESAMMQIVNIDRIKQIFSIERIKDQLTNIYING